MKKNYNRIQIDGISTLTQRNLRALAKAINTPEHLITLQKKCLIDRGLATQDSKAGFMVLPEIREAFNKFRQGM